MVRAKIVAVLLVAVLAAMGGLVHAQSVDWSRAGGSLFGEAAGPETVTEPFDAGVARVPALSQPLMAEIAEAADRHGLDEKLLHALVLQESGYRHDAMSRAGAAGLTQLMPETARDLGVEDRLDPVQNLRGGAAYLAAQINRFQDLRLALAAFNAGPNRVARLGRVPEIQETQHYVSAVLACYLALAAGRTVTSARQCGSPP